MGLVISAWSMMMPYRDREDTPALQSGSTPAVFGRGVIAIVAVVVVLTLLYLPVFAHAADVWRTDEEFSFGFLMPPVALVILWLRRGTLREARAQGQGANIGLVVLACGLLMLIAGARSGVHAVAGASFVVTVTGAAAYLFGLRAARALFFPAVVLTISLSLYRGLLNSVGFSLQGLTARYAASAASLLGVPVRRAGVDLFAGQFHFVVAEACSGLSSLLALLCLGTLIVGFAQGSLLRRLFLLALVIPIVLVANVIRVTLVLTLAQVFGLAVAQGFIHSMFSATLFLAALALFFLLGSILNCLPSLDATAWS